MARALLYITLVAAVPAMFVAFVALGGSGNDVWREVARATVPGLPDPALWAIEAIAAVIIVVVGQRALALTLASSKAAELGKKFRDARNSGARRDGFRRLCAVKGQHALFLIARWGLEDEDAAIQELALIHLLEAERDALVPLCKAIDDQKFKARADAYELLGGMGHAAAPYLNAACSGMESDASARNAACAALRRSRTST